ncbi:MAG: metallophosphoesterase family protein [Streptosporangiaceae bacterium]|nr:metallophosphoesterase family protein [Streptosporangiaceae bacterium]
MRLGIIADIHGNEVALRAILQDADRLEVDRWWALGDLVLFGPRPAEALELLQDLPGLGMLRGNTDRYVLTGEQPAPHATAAAAAASVGLVERYAAMAAGIGWTRGVLDEADLLSALTDLPGQLRLQLPGGATVLGVHASPQADDGPGIEPCIADEYLRPLLAGCGADVVVGGHTHVATDRLVDSIRALNSPTFTLRTWGIGSPRPARRHRAPLVRVIDARHAVVCRWIFTCSCGSGSAEMCLSGLTPGPVIGNAGRDGK